MNILVRYFSRSGNTKMVAEAIAEACGVKAVSVDAPEAWTNDDVDVLFIGGALYAYGIDKHLKNYIENLDGTKVRKAVVFSTSWISKHSVDLIKNGLKARGIDVAEDYFYVKNTPSAGQLEDAKNFAKQFI
ncbi:MAG: flavodoxin [Lachnospiraceae bacterium]|uniref:Flavodoxin family protein n=1 Tax=Candidatus Weimeria bifida TaxID=2599074 RepID=A0A6N7IWD1_9FIRM|nr:flavodoxin family protein [Candidatus Weimeria bifida]RRF96141.1 MAG: flavodoxin [Lachnospiraceae bacterium]